MEAIKNNKKAIATAIAFTLGGLSALGYIIPKPFVDLVYSVLGLGVLGN